MFTQNIDDHFSIGVPYARAINPVSKTNWEGTGVTPDVKAAAADAHSVALQMARRRALEYGHEHNDHKPLEAPAPRGRRTDRVPSLAVFHRPVAG